MTSYVAVDLRRLVAERAGRSCEYCLIAEADTYLGCQVDHIVSEKHGGPTDSDNLAYACSFCNRSKGTDLGSVIFGRLERFYNPRLDRWSDHFEIRGATIVPRTPIGEVTARILQFDVSERLHERTILVEIGRYPPPQPLV